jgi:hypothetical protein
MISNHLLLALHHACSSSTAKIYGSGTGCTGYLMNKYKSSSGNVYCTACASNTHASSCGSDNTTSDSNISAGTCAAGYDSSAASDGTNATSDGFTLAAIPSAVITAGNNLTDLLDDTFTNMGLYGGTDGKGALATLVVRYIAILVSDGIIL